MLHRAAANARGAITISYSVAGGQSTISAVSHTGYATRFSVLADPNGNGGFEPEGSIDLPGDGQTVTRTWPGALGAINVGHFVGGRADEPPIGRRVGRCSALQTATMPLHPAIFFLFPFFISLFDFFSLPILSFCPLAPFAPVHAEARPAAQPASSSG